MTLTMKTLIWIDRFLLSVATPMAKVEQFMGGGGRRRKGGGGWGEGGGGK